MRDFAHQHMGWLIEIVGHLHRKHAARRQRAEKPLQLLEMARHPLEYRIGKQNVGFFGRHPVRDIGLDEIVSRQPFAGLPQHVGRRIDAGDRRLRPALDQKLGRISRPAPDIDHLARIGHRDLRQQIARRPGPLVLEFEILLRAPVRHAQLPCQLLVLHPMRDDGVLAEPPHLVLFVILEIALEPLDMAIALEGQDMGGDAIEEPAVMADDHGAAGEILQRLFQRAQRVDIEIVGGLVEQQNVGAGLEHLGQMHPVAFAA